ncbi:hypothetical protein C3V36_13300 [Lachnospiraceae bacterium oral taxon 500]|nr:hypothetical protein C3V36_13300 [Lachnospiraceae bacterium oral taxon 500]
MSLIRLIFAMKAIARIGLLIAGCLSFPHLFKTCVQQLYAPACDIDIAEKKGVFRRVIRLFVWGRKDMFRREI